jgi:hypothetical protein
MSGRRTYLFQYFQSVIAIELAVTGGALLWQIRFFEIRRPLGPWTLFWPPGHFSGAAGLVLEFELP